MRKSLTNDPISPTEAAALFGALDTLPVIVLAVSGGPDSTALMWLAARWRDGLERAPKLVAVTIDHRLRKESAREALTVEKLAKALKVEHRTLRWTGRKPKTGIQEAARDARYRLLAQAARRAGARHVLTAHTLDDQAETVLFRLARGSGIAGLKGMRAVRSFGARRSAPSPLRGEGGYGEAELQLVRPLLSMPKSRLLATLAAAGISFTDDPSNRDPRFTRPRLRELMPQLAAEGLDARRLAAFAQRIARADRAIEQAVDAVMAQSSTTARSISFGPSYAALPAEVALRALGRAIAQMGDEGPAELGKLEALHAALDTARAENARFRRTLGGAMITLTRNGVTVECAPPRRIGGKTSRRKGAFTKRR